MNDAQALELINKVNQLSAGQRLNLYQVMGELAPDLDGAPAMVVMQAAYDEITYVATGDEVGEVDAGIGLAN